MTNTSPFWNLFNCHFDGFMYSPIHKTGTNSTARYYNVIVTAIKRSDVFSQQPPVRINHYVCVTHTNMFNNVAYINSLLMYVVFFILNIFLGCLIKVRKVDTLYDTVNEIPVFLHFDVKNKIRSTLARDDINVNLAEHSCLARAFATIA
ncbi:hypothetical protein K1T71_013263 [Dendrolimus kikuchii]|uniref:Uncharacterized protein n=1 Tax=Dendrolimus kikuchii TaxID=765133 RepID=A0ACC1CHL6_9NEOP|nr:hypothetical protein K1T71_013263 [Dendrolimus kikuchii]